jgi:hypothetical protein
MLGCAEDEVDAKESAARPNSNARTSNTRKFEFNIMKPFHF